MNSPTVSDLIKIENLRVMGVIGLNMPERSAVQEILINVTLQLDLRQTAATDSVIGGLNYSHVAKSIIAHVESAQRFTLETLATDVAGICLGFSQISKAHVRISKPAAERLAQCISVDIERTREMLDAPALIGLASNVSAATNLSVAVSRLSAIGTVVAVSSVYESPAIGAPAENYLNAVARVDTCLPAAEIRRVLKKIEADLGRTPESKATGRVPIDLDLCMLGQQVIAAKDVTIPDENIAKRESLAKACAEALPDGIYPITSEPLIQIAKRLAGSMNLIARGDVRLIPSPSGRGLG